VGCELTDVDGNVYLDFQNNYTALVHGHAHPAITAALERQLPKSTIYGAPAESQFELAELLTSRLPGVDLVRFTNSGTEATMMAMRAARAFTGKPVILKMDGGYHGSQDLAEINISPDLSGADLPVPHVESQGIPDCVLDSAVIARFNDLESVEQVLCGHQNEIAAIITEPLMNAAGMIPPRGDFLPGLRRLADRYGVLLIFDEVVTFRLHLQGYQGKAAVQPDLTALGKAIGGGLPVGAFGGRAEILSRFDPASEKAFHHSGTFNANPMTMAAGAAAVKHLDAAAIQKINQLGERMRTGIGEAFLEAGISGYASGEGSLLYIHWTADPVMSPADVVRWKQKAADLPRLLHLALLNLGIFTANRGMFNISTPMESSHIDTAVSAFSEALNQLKPYAAEAAPHLLN
jgi:glutamate-1-semialdehyde 2,1-aminomutase